MSKIAILKPLALCAPLFVGGCSGHRSDAGNEREAQSAEVGHPAEDLRLDLAAPRLCTVTAYESSSEPTKFAIGDYAVSSPSDTTPSALPLSKIVRSDEAGQPSEARFAIYFRRPTSHSTSLLTPYSPLPLLSADATSMTFATPADIAGGDRSTLKVSAPGGPSTVVLQFDETVHGRTGRSMAIECTAGDAG